MLTGWLAGSTRLTLSASTEFVEIAVIQVHPQFLSPVWAKNRRKNKTIFHQK
jgi:hypothetical protein